MFSAALMALLTERFLHYRFLYLDRFSQASSRGDVRRHEAMSPESLLSPFRLPLPGKSFALAHSCLGQGSLGKPGVP